MDDVPDFMPVSFSASIGAHTFIDGYFLVMLILFLYSRFKNNYTLPLKIINLIFLIAFSWTLLRAIVELSTSLWNSFEYISYVAEIGYLSLIIGLVYFCTNLLLFIKKIRESVRYSFIIASITIICSVFLLYDHLFLKEHASYLPASNKDFYPFILDKLDGGITFLIILLITLLVIKAYKTLRLRLSPHKWQI